MIGNLTTAALFQAEYHQVARLTVLREDAPVIYAILSDNSRKLLTQVVMSDDSVVDLDGVTFENDPYHFDESHIFTGGLTVDQYSITGDRIEIGSAVAAELRLHLKNSDGLFDPMIFAGMEIAVEIGTKNWESDDPITYIPLGIFMIDSEPKNGDEINITALDRMVSRFDKEIDWTQFTFPMDVETLVSTVCTVCGVTCVTDISLLPNASYIIDHAPTGSCTMYRELIQWAAFMTATCAQFDENGDLRFRWYTPTGFELTPANRFSHEIENTDITLTGIHYKDEEGEEILVGTADYTLEASGCGILQDDVSSALNDILDAVEDFSYRPFEASIITAPFLQPLDMISFTDARGNDHTCIISHVTYVLNDSTDVAGVGNTKVSTEYTPQSGLTAQQKEAVNDARRQAINYLASDSTGVMVADMSDGNRHTPSTVPLGVKNAFIDNDSFDVRDGTTVLATFGEQSRIGKSTGRHVTLENDGFKVKNGSAVLADFGAVTTIGPESNIHIRIDPTDGSLSIIKGQNLVATIWLDGTDGNIEMDHANLDTIDAEEITVGGRATGVVSVFNSNGRMIQLKSQASNDFTGLYEDSLSKWLIYADGDGECNIPKVFSNLVVDKSVKTPQASAFVEVISSDGNGEAAGDIALYASLTGRCGIYQRSAGKWMIYNELGTRIPDLNFSDTGSGTVGSNYTAAPSKTCQLTKIGRIVSMQMSLGFSTGRNTLAMNDTLFTIPSDFRPFSSVKVPSMMIRGTGYMPYPGHVKVSSSGVVTQDESSNITGIYCFAQWETA